MGGKMLLSPEQINMERIENMARVFLRVNRALAGQHIRVQTVFHPFNSAPSWTDGVTITFNAAHIGSVDSIEDIIKLTGLNYHELGHVFYTPRANSALSKHAQQNGNFKAFNILEDQRLETLMVGTWTPIEPYFVTMFMKFIGNDREGWPRALVLTHGRRYLPDKVRKQFGDIFERQDLRPKVESIIDEYRQLIFPADNDRAGVLVDEFGDVLRALSAMPKDPNGHIAGQRPDVPTAGRPLAPKDQEVDRERAQDREEEREEERAEEQDEDEPNVDEDIEDGLSDFDDEDDEEDDDAGPGVPEADSSDEGDDGEPEAPAADDTDEADADGDGRDDLEPDAEDDRDGPGDEDVDGDGSGTEDGADQDESDAADQAGDSGEDDESVDSSDSDDELDADSNGSDGDDTEEDTTPSDADDVADEQQDEEPEEDSIPEPPKIDEDWLRKMFEDVIREAETNPEVLNDARQKQDTIVNGDGDLYKRLPEADYFEKPVPPDVKLAASKFSQELQRLVVDSDPGWNRYQSSGKLNVQRLLEGGDLETVFDQWQEGNDLATDTETIILVDMSTSMARVMEQAMQSVWAIKKAAEAGQGNVTVLGYSGPKYVGGRRGPNHDGILPESDWYIYGRADKAQPGKYRSVVPWSGTNVSNSLEEAARIFYASKHENQLLYLVTDGAWMDEYQAEERIQKMNAAGVLTVLVWLNNITDDFLEALPDEDSRKIWAEARDQQEETAVDHGCKVFEKVRTAGGLVQVARKVVKQQMSRRK